MFLIQQSSSFRVWTSRALMVYFRRALLFLVVSPRQNAIQHRILSQERQKVCFSDAEDDEETTMNDRSGLADSLLDQREDSTNRMQISQLKKCIGKELAQAINNSMSKSIEKETDQSLVIVNFEEPSDPEQVEPSANDLNQGSKTFSIKTAHHRQIDENKQSDDSVSPPRQHLFSHHHSHFNGTDSIPFSPSCHRLSSMSHSEKLSPSSDDEEDIYEKYQTSFWHILHQTKSLNTICQEDKLHSMLTLEPNTSIISVRPLPYHRLNRNPIDYSIFASHVRVRLIAYQPDPSIHCDAEPIGCKDRPLTNNEPQRNSNQNKKSSISIDMPYKILYIDT